MSFDLGDTKIGGWMYRAYARNKTTIFAIVALVSLVAGVFTILALL